MLSARQQRDSMVVQNNLLRDQRGFFEAKAPDLDSRYGSTWANITGADRS